jgi:hypothetical protein
MTMGVKVTFLHSKSNIEYLFDIYVKIIKTYCY